MRRAVMIAAAVLLLVEAVAIVLLNWVMGIVVDRQRMSVGGLDPDVMSVGTWALGAAGGLFLATVAVILVRAAVRDRAPGRMGRTLVTVCAVVHGLAGAALVGLAGWGAFAGAVVVLGLLVLSLLLFREERAASPGGPGGSSPSAPKGPPVRPQAPPAEPGPTAV